MLQEPGNGPPSGQDRQRKSAQLPVCRCLVVSLRFKAEVDDARIMNMFRMHSSCWNDGDRYGLCMFNSQQYVNVRIWMFIRRRQVVVWRMCRNLVFDSPVMLDANLVIGVIWIQCVYASLSNPFSYGML